MQLADLASNALTGPVPAGWSNWSQVGRRARHDVGVCRMRNTQPAPICACMQVKILNMDHNQLSGTVPYVANLAVLNVSSVH